MLCPEGYLLGGCLPGYPLLSAIASPFSLTPSLLPLLAFLPPAASSSFTAGSAEVVAIALAHKT